MESNSLGRVVLEQEAAEVALAHLVPATNQLGGDEHHNQNYDDDDDDDSEN